MTIKMQCVSKNADDTGSRVVFALNPKTTQTQQGKVLTGETMATIVFTDPQKADEFKHGSYYSVAIDPVQL